MSNRMSTTFVSSALAVTVAAAAIAGCGVGGGNASGGDAGHDAANAPTDAAVHGDARNDDGGGAEAGPDTAGDAPGAGEAGADAAPDAAALGLGVPCGADADCASGLCKPVVPGQSAICVRPCQAQADCAQASGFFCEPIAAGSTAGYCVPPSPAHCASCAADGDCGVLSEACFLAPGDVAKACHVDCSLAGTAACPSDYACVDETVNGVARKLCRPTVVPSCLDAAGGFCDRVSTPQPCARTNSAGTCNAQRACVTALKRFDICEAPSPQCKADCSMQDPTGCTETFCAAATSTPANCGTCGHVCPGYQKPSDNVTCTAAQTCTFSCQGENYDVNGNATDGCEVADAPTGNHTQTNPASGGSLPCTDGSSNPNLSGKILSDARVHEVPAVVGFNTATGAAADWTAISATGGLACVDDIDLTLQITGSSMPACYKLTVNTSTTTLTAQTNASGTAHVSMGSGAYADNTTIYIVVEKTCGTTVAESVTYTVTGHL